VVREEVEELVAEYSRAAWFQHNNGHSGIDLGSEAGQDALEVAPGFVEETEVIERSSAADVLRRDFDALAHAVEELCRGAEGLGMEVVVPGVRPEEYGLTGRGGVGRVAMEAVAEVFSGEGGQGPMRSDASDGFDKAAEPRDLQGQ